MIRATAKKDGEYYHAVLVITDNSYKQRYVSKDMFLNRKTAIKQAEWWKHETLEIGQVINY